MIYDKPELTPVGDAAQLIEGSKSQKPDPGSTSDLGNAADCEFDD